MALDNGFQAGMRAPTEILANQHYETIRELLYGMEVRVELLTGSVKGKRREAIPVSYTHLLVSQPAFEVSCVGLSGTKVT